MFVCFSNGTLLSDCVALYPRKSSTITVARSSFISYCMLFRFGWFLCGFQFPLNAKCFTHVYKIPPSHTMCIHTRVTFAFRFWEICHQKLDLPTKQLSTKNIRTPDFFVFYHVALITDNLICPANLSGIRYEPRIKVDSGVSSLSFCFCLHGY